MKKRTTLLIIKSVFIGIFFISCESHEQKADAFEIVKEGKMSPSEEETLDKEVVVPTEKTEPIAVKTVEPVIVIDEWTSFILETGKKIKRNENKIKEIKSTPDASSKLLKKVIVLEKDNNSLNQQIETYKQEEKVRWATFKAKINQDASTISLGLKEVVITN